jgi:hypothetical protein
MRYLVKNKLPITIPITNKNTENDRTIREQIIYLRIVQFLLIFMQQTLLIDLRPFSSRIKNISNNLFLVLENTETFEIEFEIEFSISSF